MWHNTSLLGHNYPGELLVCTHAKGVCHITDAFQAPHALALLGSGRGSGRGNSRGNICGIVIRVLFRVGTIPDFFHKSQ